MKCLILLAVFGCLTVGLVWGVPDESTDYGEDVIICDEGTLTTVPESINPRVYLLCKEGKWSTRFCPFGEAFNHDKKQCQERQLLCDEGSTKYDFSNTRLFWECQNGSWEMKDCPDNTRYDRLSSKCKYEWGGVYGERLVFPDELENMNNNKDNQTPSNDCGPPDDCPDGQYFPNPCDCTKYYQCDHGSGVPKECGSGTAWNVELTTCDHKHKVKSCKSEERKIKYKYLS